MVKAEIKDVHFRMNEHFTYVAIFEIEPEAIRLKPRRKIYRLVVRYSSAILIKLGLYEVVVEIGFILTISFILYLMVKTFNTMRNLNNRSLRKYIFCFIFGLSLIVGSLLKEPNLGRSSLIVGMMLFTRLPTQKENLQSTND